MAKILHVVNFFDPAGDVVRCLAELKRYSKHEHELIVKLEHPHQDVYGYPEAWLMYSRFKDDRETQHPGNCGRPIIDHLLEWADAILYQFCGYEDGFHDLRKPAAFRNINIYWNPTEDKFWSAPVFNARDLAPYKLLASSHVGAQDFLGADRFRWLPDLIPIHDVLYSPDFSRRPFNGWGKTVSYIKHANVLDSADLGQVAKQNLECHQLPDVLFQRKVAADIVIDQICDGHYGLAGCEAFSLGLPTIVFNHEKTKEALCKLAPFDYPPFVEVAPSLDSAIKAVREIAAMGDNEYMDLRHATRAWAEKYFDSRYLIERFWDKFFDELVR